MLQTAICWLRAALSATLSVPVATRPMNLSLLAAPRYHRVEFGFVCEHVLCVRNTLGELLVGRVVKAFEIGQQAPQSVEVEGLRTECPNVEKHGAHTKAPAFWTAAVPKQGETANVLGLPPQRVAVQTLALPSRSPILCQRSLLRMVGTASHDEAAMRKVPVIGYSCERTFLADNSIRVHLWQPHRVFGKRHRWPI